MFQTEMKKICNFINSIFCFLPLNVHQITTDNKLLQVITSYSNHIDFEIWEQKEKSGSDIGWDFP